MPNGKHDEPLWALRESEAKSSTVQYEMQLPEGKLFAYARQGRGRNSGIMCGAGLFPPGVYELVSEDCLPRACKELSRHGSNRQKTPTSSQIQSCVHGKHYPFILMKRDSALSSFEEIYRSATAGKLARHKDKFYLLPRPFVKRMKAILQHSVMQLEVCDEGASKKQQNLDDRLIEDEVEEEEEIASEDSNEGTGSEE